MMPGQLRTKIRSLILDDWVFWLCWAAVIYLLVLAFFERDDWGE
jgi:hypothetical protein